MVRSFWLGAEGEMRSDLVRVLNISKRGVALELSGAPMRDSVIRIEGERIGIKGKATVRHVWRSGSKFIVGAEFADGMTWKGAQNSQLDPSPPGPAPAPAIEPAKPPEQPAPKPESYDPDDFWRWND